MSLFEITGASGRQPLQQFRVNHNHPLAAGLVFAATPAGVYLPRTGLWIPNVRQTDFAASGALVYGTGSIPSLPEPVTSSTCSLVLRARLESDPNAFITLGLSQYTSSSDNIALGLSWDDTTNVVAPTARSNTSTYGFSGFAVSTPYEEHVCVTVNGWGASSGTYYRNAAASGTTSTPDGVYADRTVGLVLGSATMRSAYIYYYNRVLSREEDLALYLDPFCFLVEEPIWVPVSAGGGINASVTLTGCSAASAAGTTVALGSATVTLSGASSASAAGAVAASAGASVTVAGSAASSTAGALTATAGGNAVATLTGTSATSTAGSLTAGGSAGISLVGAGATGAVGAVTATAGGAASVTLTGASASAAAGILAGFGGAQITLTGASASGAAGSASASAGSGSGTGATAAEIWSYTLSSGLTAEATLVAIHTMLSELHLIHGLTAGSPLSVTAASRTAGAVSQAVAEAAGTVTVTRQ